MGVAAGGAGVEAAALACLLVAADFLSVGAAPVELRRGSAAPTSSAAPRSAREVIPFAGVRGMADLAADDLKGAVLMTKMAALTIVKGGGASAPRSVRLPARDREPPSSRPWRCCGRFRRRGVLLGEDEATVQKDLVVISLFSGQFLG